MKQRFVFLLLTLALACSGRAQNPFLPLWEYVPDGEPYVFEDPDRPGHYRVYVYGSHDSLIESYCGLEQVTWSAPVDDLTNWRYDGVIFRSTRDSQGNLLNPGGKGDLLFAPDVVVRTEADGTKTYYLYPNVQNGGRQGLVAKSKRPDGPFEVCNWSPTNVAETDGVLRFDPGVMVDDDGRVYGYWGFRESFAAELDPSTMATVKPGTKVVEHLIPGVDEPGVFRFFEASSIRKVEDKYVLIYSRFTEDGEFGLPTSNYTLAYAYADEPLGPYTYGGTIIDGRGRETDPLTGKTRHTANSGGNTHGSIFCANGQWWVVYHRQTGGDEYSRQAMAAPIRVKVEKGKGGKVTISEGEYTSEGFALEGLDPLKRTPAGLACYYVGPTPSSNSYPNFSYSGSYVRPTRYNPMSDNKPAALCPVVNNTAGSVVGYKYFNTDKFQKKTDYTLVVNLTPEGVDATVRVLLGDPVKGTELGRLTLNKHMAQVPSDVRVPVGRIRPKQGKQALYFVFESATQGKSVCELNSFLFTE